MSRRRLYVPLAVDYYLDEKVAEACDVSPWCEVLWTRLLARAKDAETEGVLTRGMVIALHVPQWSKWIAVLVRVGLVAVDGDGWAVPAWLRHNLTNDQIAARREGTASRVQAHRDRRNGLVTACDHDGNEPCNASCNALHTALPLSPKPEARRAEGEGNKPPSSSTQGGSSGRRKRRPDEGPTRWDLGHDAAVAVWPDSDDEARRRWAGVLVKAPGDPERLTRLAGAILRLHGFRGLDQLSNNTRSALVARLPQVLALNPTPGELERRWAAVAAAYGWPNDLGQRLERLLSGWDRPPAPRVVGKSAASRQASSLDRLEEDLAAMTAHEQPLAIGSGA